MGGGRSTERYLSAVRERRAVYADMEAKALTFDRRFGWLFASSGYRVSKTDSMLDWALVRVLEERAGYNVV